MTEGKEENLKRALGMNRRDLIKRGAVVGGALLWAAPAIQTIAAPAYAVGNLSMHTCCTCTLANNSGQTCALDHFTYETCLAFCDGHGNSVREYVQGPHGCDCSSRNRCQCS